MERRRITLADGRYMIFYTFDDEPQEARLTTTATSAEQDEKERPSEAEPLKETPRV
jgi:hypothetical protein